MTPVYWFPSLRAGMAERDVIAMRARMMGYPSACTHSSRMGRNAVRIPAPRYAGFTTTYEAERTGGALVDPEFEWRRGGGGHTQRTPSEGGGGADVKGRGWNQNQCGASQGSDAVPALGGVELRGRGRRGRGQGGRKGRGGAEGCGAVEFSSKLATCQKEDFEPRPMDPLLQKSCSDPNILTTLPPPHRTHWVPERCVPSETWV